MSTVNTTDRVRISCDVRWQPAAEPRDERYFGDVDRKVAERQKAGAWAAAGGGKGAAAVVEKARTMEDMKLLWGFK